jgi:predicted nucleic acid-binding protein
MIVIADTGPINYLILIGKVEVLPGLYHRITVPPPVCEELGRPRAERRFKLKCQRPAASMRYDLECSTAAAACRSGSLAAD